MVQKRTQSRRGRLKPWGAVLLGLLMVLSVWRLRLDLLIHASATGNVLLARFALALGADPNALSTDEDYELALIVAAENRNFQLVRLLLDAGADPNRSDGVETALIAAVMSDDRTSTRLLLKHGANPNGHWKDGTSVLYCVPAPPDPKIVAMLKEAGGRY